MLPDPIIVFQFLKCVLVPVLEWTPPTLPNERPSLPVMFMHLSITCSSVTAWALMLPKWLLAEYDPEVLAPFVQGTFRVRTGLLWGPIADRYQM